MSTLEQASEYYKSGNHTKVIELCKKVLAKNVDFNALRLMGLALYKKNLLRDSLAMLEYAEQVNPNHLDLQLDKVDTMMKLAESADYKSFIKAALILRSLIKKYPDNFRAHKQLKDIYQKMFLNNNAERLLVDFLKRNPGSAEMNYEYYGYLLMLGRFDEARVISQKAISLNPIYALDFTWEKINKDYDPQQRIDQLIKIDETVATNSYFKSFYYLSRALAHQKQKDFAAAFKYFQKANNKYRTTVDYQPMKYINQFQHMIKAFSKEKYKELCEFSKEFSEPDIVPVFIVGLPRSGSTLIESILCAHPEVQGVGEINDFRENIVGTLNDITAQKSVLTYRLDNIDKETLLNLRDRYLKLLKTKNARVNKGSKAKLLINKMLTNFQYVPLIKAMFPNAKIIHAKRHPVDTLWSCYKVFFNGDDNYIYNLKELALHYNLYRELTDHWHGFMGDDFLAIDHEKLTKNPKEEIERLLNYCQIDWDDRCLNFHKEVKTVRTASFEQVRNPITHKEKMAWQDYEPYLDELINNINPKFLNEKRHCE
jgi:tetratricopeptide (TPR) repeat protein